LGKFFHENLQEFAGGACYLRRLMLKYELAKYEAGKY